jgi:hypothetical protein
VIENQDPPRKGPGGKRAGAGRKKGSKSLLDKEIAREALRKLVAKELKPLVLAQIENAKGIKFLMVRAKSSGKFVRVTKSRAEMLNEDEEIIEVWEKDPSVQAFSDLMNRVLDKPKEQEQEIKLTGEAELIGLLLAGRKRAAEARGAGGEGQ